MSLKTSHFLWLVSTCVLLSTACIQTRQRNIPSTACFFVESVRDKQCFGDDIAMLVTADRPKRLRWYTAKAQEVTQVHVLRAEPFQAILDQPKFAHFRRHIRVYGTWIAVKVKLVELAMEKRLHVIYAGGAPDDGAAAAHHHRPHANVSWADLKDALGGKKFAKFADVAAKFGYDAGRDCAAVAPARGRRRR